MKVLVINGPNLNMLGIREPSVYGNNNYQYLCELIINKAKLLDCDVELYQSNHEGAIIDKIHEAYFNKTDAIIINPGAYTHYSYAIFDAIKAVGIKTVEVHISDISKREDFRKNSVISPACALTIKGKGLDGYLEALEYVCMKLY